jgi:serine/threonine protein kinase
MRMAQPSWIGHKLNNRYEIIELLGEGGMATVYKANDPSLQRIVAVKLIHSHLSRQPEFVRRFEAEAAAVAQLRHPNIIQVFDFASDNNVYYIVFEFLAGETLRDHLERLRDNKRKMPYEQVIKIGSDIASALNYAHSRGLVHRDVKPANVMLNFNDDAILMDFGIVKIAGGTQHTATGAVVGTASYMSPEQIRGEATDHRTDIYAAGIMLFQMVGGRLPYVADSAMTVMMMQVNDPVPDLSQLRPDVPADLVRIINKALQKGKGDRYQSAGELLQDLRNTNLSAASAATLGGTLPPYQPAGDARYEQTLDDLEMGYRQPSQQPSYQGAPPVISSTGPASQSSRSGGFLSSIPLLGGRRGPLIGGCLGLLLLVICAVAAVSAFNSPLGDRILGREVGTATPDTVLTGNEATETAQAVAAAATETDQEVEPTNTASSILDIATVTTAPTTDATETPTPTETAAAPTATSTDEPPTAAPTATSNPPTNTPAPTATPSFTSTPAGLTVHIRGISLSGSTYIVDYTTSGYTEALPGMHIHFFFNTVPPEQAGLPGGGPWYVWGGPRPFNGYTTGDRPGSASQMCALVANADHSIVLNTGNCANLP